MLGQTLNLATQVYNPDITAKYELRAISWITIGEQFDVLNSAKLLEKLNHCQRSLSWTHGKRFVEFEKFRERL